MNKKGFMGDSIMMMYRLLLVTVIAFAVFIVAGIFYNYEIDVRDAEARILGREMVECLVGDGVLNLDEIGEDDYGRIVSYCGFSFSDRLYVEVGVSDSSGKNVAKFYEGDSGALWVRDLFVLTGNAIFDESSIDEIERYSPGYYEGNYSVFVLNDGVKFEGKINVEVLVRHEE